MKTWRIILRIAALTAALLSGTLFTACPMYGAVALYGPQPAYGIMPPPHDPTVVLQDFSYTPASPIQVGDLITFTAVLNKTTGSGSVTATVGQPPQFAVSLNDEGLNGDAQADDGVYAATGQWDAHLGTGEDLPVEGQLTWYDGAPGQQLAGPPLTVLPEEGGQ